MLLLQRTIKLRGNAMYDFCEERGFVTRSRWQWWNGTVYVNKKGIPFRSAIQLLLKDVRCLAVLGKLPGEYNESVLAITGDTPAMLAPKFKRKPCANGKIEPRAD